MCKFDKSKDVAVLKSDDYDAKLDVNVNGTSKFVEISSMCFNYVSLLQYYL